MSFHNPNNAEAFALAKELFPGGVNSPVRAFRHVGLEPPVFSSGKGAWVRDLDGKRYLDCCMAWGSLILGHAPVKVVQAVARRVKRGSSFGAPTIEENQLGALVRACMPSLERLRFVSSGTEAVMSAVRLARGATGRRLIVTFAGCYHGHSDGLLVQAGSGVADAGLPGSAGVDAATTAATVSLPYNDILAAQAFFTARGTEVAAVVVEAVAANMGVIRPAPGFLEELRKLTSASGSLLIIDEVITGFRLASGGAQELFGIKPDLCTCGKIVGGGFPAAAYGGRADLMRLIAPDGPVYQAGTLSGNPVAMVAGYQTIKELESPGVRSELEQTSADFGKKLYDIVHAHGYSVEVVGSMFTIFFRSQAPKNYEETKAGDFVAFRRFYQTALKAGVYLSPSPFETHFLSTAHGPKERHVLLEVLDHALGVAAKGDLT